MPFRAFALTIDRNLMHGAEVADAQLGPSYNPLAERIPSRLRTGAMLWSGRHASEFTEPVARSPRRSSSDFAQYGS